MNSDGDIWYRHGLYADWELIPGNLKQITVGHMGVFGIDSDEVVYYRKGTHKNPTSAGSDWQEIAGKLSYISSGRNAVLGVNSRSEIFSMENVAFTKDHLLCTWDARPGDLKQISICGGNFLLFNSCIILPVFLTCVDQFIDKILTQPTYTCEKVGER